MIVGGVHGTVQWGSVQCSTGIILYDYEGGVALYTAAVNNSEYKTLFTSIVSEMSDCYYYNYY